MVYYMVPYVCVYIMGDYRKDRQYAIIGMGGKCDVAGGSLG